MSEQLNRERLKSPAPVRELERRAAELQKAMKAAGIDMILAQNITQYLCGCNRYMTDTTAENNYPQSSFLPADDVVHFIACSGPPLGAYPPEWARLIGKPYATAPYFSPFNYTNEWEGQYVVKWCVDNNAKKIGIAGFGMFYWNYYETIKKMLPELEIVDVSDMFDEIRAVKSADEQEYIAKTVKVQDKVMGYVRAYAHAGVREYELRSKLQQVCADHGSEEQIIVLGSAPKGEKFDLMPSFFQNRTLQSGDQLYVRLSVSGPGGLFCTVGRMFCVDEEPSAQMQADWEKALAAQKYLADKLVPGADPQVIFADYNNYLASNGYKTEQGLFCYGQGYDNVERPSAQPGETMKIGCDMCMAMNTSLVNNVSSVYCADSFMIKGDGAVRMHKTPQTIVRTY